MSTLNVTNITAADGTSGITLANSTGKATFAGGSSASIVLMEIAQ